MEDFLNPASLLTFIGFAIAAFAFLSQYLNFPKDILTEWARIGRNLGKHEFPHKIDKKNFIIQKDFRTDKYRKRANTELKVFFLENDTISFSTLTYLVYSIGISLSLLAELIEFTILRDLFIGILTFIYVAIILLGIFYNAYHKKIRDWPKEYKYAKAFYVTINILISSLLGLSVLIYNCQDKQGSIFFIVIVGVFLHFIVYLIPIFHRAPITKLVILWETLWDREPELEKSLDEQEKNVAEEASEKVNGETLHNSQNNTKDKGD